MEISETGYSICPQRIQGDLAVGPLLYFSASLISNDFDTADGWIGFIPLTNVNPKFDEASFTNIFQDSGTTTCIEIQE